MGYRYGVPFLEKVYLDFLTEKVKGVRRRMGNEEREMTSKHPNKNRQTKLNFIRFRQNLDGEQTTVEEHTATSSANHQKPTTI